LIQIIQSRKDNCIAFEVNGKLTKDDVRKLSVPTEIIKSSQGKAKAMMKIKSFTGYNFQSFLDDLKINIYHIQSFDKLAVIGDPQWRESLQVIKTYFPGVNVKVFDESDTEDAWDWLDD
jgi:hypothetical protein